MGLSKPYIVVSSDHEELFSRFAVVELATRNADDFRFRSNRLAHGQLTKSVAPDPSDRIVKSHIINTNYTHSGGMQAIGKYLLVGSDTKIDGSKNSTLISLWDMSNPPSPRLVWEKEVDKHNANSMGIVRLEDGRYLMLRALVDARKLEFYVKRSSDITENNWDLWDNWHYDSLKSELVNPDGTLDRKWADLDCPGSDAGYQNTNIVAECGTGTLYLIASHGRCPNNPVGAGGDFVDAYRLDVPTSQGDVVITKVAKRKMFPFDGTQATGFVYQGDFQAAGGAYISPDNKLYFYATEHGRNGPNSSVKMIEFGPEEPRSQVSSIDEAWVELYEDTNFDGRSLILDYVDRDLRDYNDFDRIEKFEDIASSVIYAIPVGYRLRLYENDNQGGDFLILNGTGRAERISDLHNVLFNGKVVGDNISSAVWDVGSSAEVWVAFNYGGLIQIGTFQFPFKTLSRGLAGVLPGGIIKIKSSSSNETLIINKPVTLQAPNGAVVIGKK